ncbi:MAG TPA: DUF4271 domain-containing protein [Chitinophagaceae bacterium]
MTWQRFIFLLAAFCWTAGLQAQADSTRSKDSSHNRRVDTSQRRKDSIRIRRDTVRPVQKPAPKPVTVQPDTSVVVTNIPAQDSLAADSVQVVSPPVILKDTGSYQSYFHHPWLGFDRQPVYMLMKERFPESKDRIFYLIAGLMFFVAFSRVLFPKYFQNTFRLFFQTSFRQKQTRDQLLQQSLGSLLLNLLFFFSAAIYLTLVLDYYSWAPFPFWQLLLYSLLMIGCLYIGKFLFLKFAGWVFNVKEGAETYIFIVFLINKIIGVMLIPFILVIAFAGPDIVTAAIAASVILLIMLFVYRYFVSLKSFRRDLHINPFHFFLYLCGVEIVPLLVIGKAVFSYIDGRF